MRKLVTIDLNRGNLQSRLRTCAIVRRPEGARAGQFYACGPVSATGNSHTYYHHEVATSLSQFRIRDGLQLAVLLNSYRARGSAGSRTVLRPAGRWAINTRAAPCSVVSTTTGPLSEALGATGYKTYLNVTDMIAIYENAQLRTTWLMQNSFMSKHDVVKLITRG